MALTQCRDPTPIRTHSSTRAVARTIDRSVRILPTAPSACSCYLLGVDSIVEKNREALIALAKKRRAHRLSIFGSLATERFDPVHSDIDVLVEFEPLAPVDRADAFFGLLEDLERVFGRPVDLVERAALRNPIMLRSVETNQVVIYEAA